MLPLFESLAPVTLFSQSLAGKLEILKSVFRRRGWRLPDGNPARSLFERRVGTKCFDLVYSNTVTNSEILKLTARLNPPVICHVHELEWGITHYGLDRFNITKDLTDRFVAVSKAVRENLVQNHSIQTDVIDINYEFIPTSQFDKINVEQARTGICEEYDIPKSSAIICASGTTGWRKGPDLFIQLAIAVQNLMAEVPVYFFWIGGQGNGPEYQNLIYDIEKSGFARKIKFIPEQEQPFEYFAAADLFVMVSREDPFPLVCLEAAALGKPILCFENAGGMPEFVGSDAGFSVPYLDIMAMARKCVDLVRSPDLSAQMGRQAKYKVKRRHDVEVAGANLLQIIENEIEKG